jgi:hypothetical protein
MTDNSNLPDHANRMQDLLNGIANIANSIADAGGVASGLPFIGINGDGLWSYGQERIIVEEGSEWALDIRTLMHGYIAWPPAGAKERKPLGERMVSANAPLPRLADLPDVGVPYTMQFGVELKCVSGEDDGTVALYKNGSYGAKAMIKQLVLDVRKQAQVDQTRLCPVVELQIRSYLHPDWKKTFHNPILKMVRWIGEDDYDGHGIVPVEPEQPPRAAVQAEPPKPEPRAAARGNGRQPEAAAPEPQPQTARRRPGRATA